MQVTHTLPPYFLSPLHPVTVNLIGCGGTGSQLLAKLAQIDHALKAGGLGMGPHPGFHVRVFDADEVTPTNVGRQGFFATDVGTNKAVVLVSRVNRAFGLAWEAIPMLYSRTVMDKALHRANIIITCVDTAKARIEIAEMQGREGESRHPFEKEYYWLDLGNARHTGQVVLGTLNPIPQPTKLKQTVKQLPTITEMFPNLSSFDTEDIQGEACSLAESLHNQDLCVNSMMAEWGKKILWNLFKQMRITSHGVFVNLESMTVNPIPIGRRKRSRR